jgi:hypothetical protein
MKITLSTERAVQCLLADESGGWSKSGARRVIEHLERLEVEHGEEIEFDAEQISCEFTEYSSSLEAAEAHGFASEETNRDWLSPVYTEALNWLRERTTVLRFCEGVIIRNLLKNN